MPDHPVLAKDIVINGRFLAQKLSGVQRYAREIVTALDSLIAADPDGLGRHRWRLAVPTNADPSYTLATMAIERAGRREGHAWEQIDLLRAARGARLVNLGNSGPILHRDALVVIHDAAPYRTPDNFGARYGAFHRALGRVLARTARIGTVSNFSRGELADVLRLDPAAIFVANNGADHLIGRTADTGVVAKLGVEAGRYFLFVGSPTRNKNLDAALRAFQLLGRDGIRFVVAGSLNTAVFGGVSPASIPGVIVADGLSDPEITGLYTDAAALVFPSRYEGFGIPPLEAMVCGCPVLAADIPVLREVCGDAAVYFDPTDPVGMAGAMAARLDEGSLPASRAEAADARVRRYTWENGARSLADAVVMPQLVG